MAALAGDEASGTARPTLADSLPMSTRADDVPRPGGAGDAAYDSLPRDQFGQIVLPDINTALVTDSRSAVTTEDTFAQSLRAKSFGAMIMNVHDLSPEWKKGPASSSQRPCLLHNQRALVQSMRHGIRRTEPHQRLKVSCTRAEFEQCLRYTARRYADWYEADEITTRYTVDSLRDLYKHVQTATPAFHQFPVLLWDPTLTTAPQLEAGQHRRAALIQINDSAEISHTDLNLGTIAQIGWVVDLVDVDELSDLEFHRLRQNAPDVQAIDSDGDLFLRLSGLYDDFLVTERERVRNPPPSTVGQPRAAVDRFVHFIHDAMGSPVPNGRRFYTLLSIPLWRHQLVKWLEFGSTRQSFVVFHFVNAEKSLLDDYWFKYFKTVIHRLEHAFLHHARLLTAADVKLLAGIGQFNENQEALRVLFYPTPDDRHTAALPVLSEWFTNIEYRRFRLQVVRDFGEFECEFRRPDFLPVLNEAAYNELYEHLRGVNHAVTAPSTTAAEIRDTAEKLQHLTRHMLYWVDPTWTAPASSSSERRGYSMIDTITKHYGSHPAAAADPSTTDFDTVISQKQEDDYVQRRATYHDKVLKCLRKLSSSMVNDPIAWRDVDKNWLSCYTSLVNNPPDKDARHQYRNVFSSQPAATFLSIVINDLGTSNFKGVMRPWLKDPNYHHKTAVAAPLYDRLTTLYRSVALQRFNRIDVSHPPFNHNTRVAYAMERAALIEELRTCEMVQRDAVALEDLLRQIVTRTGDPATIHDVPGEPDPSRPGHGVLQIGQAPSSILREIKAVRDQITPLLARYDVELAYTVNGNSDTNIQAVLGSAAGPPHGDVLTQDDSDYEPPLALEESARGGTTTTTTTTTTRGGTRGGTRGATRGGTRGGTRGDSRGSNRVTKTTSPRASPPHSTRTTTRASTQAKTRASQQGSTRGQRRGRGK